MEKECLAIKLGMSALCTYLLGRSFTVQTDHWFLMRMDKLKDTNAHLRRWCVSLQLSNGNADCLLRTPGHVCCRRREVRVFMWTAKNLALRIIVFISSQCCSGGSLLCDVRGTVLFCICIFGKRES